MPPLERERPQIEDDARARERRPIVCAACGATLAFAADETTRSGAHEHTFFNPAGIVYRIRLFSRADGVRALGTPSAEFSWFPGCAWQIALCAKCGAHVGWAWTGSEGAFVGLIAAAIREG